MRKATSDQVTDEAKRLFFEQRMKAATDTKASAAILDKLRKENEGHFKSAQEKKRTVARAVRESAGKSRQELLSQRTANAKALREAKLRLRDKHKEKLQLEYLEKAATVKSVIENSIYREGEATGGSPFAPGSSPSRSPKALTDRSPSPSKPGSPPLSRMSGRRMSNEGAEPVEAS